MTLRWHTHPILMHSGDTVERHSLAVTELCRDLAARIGHRLHDSDLLFAARHHDAAEAVLGDMPGPAKERFPALAAAYAKAELQVLTEMRLTWNLTRREDTMLTLCDKLERVIWAARFNVALPDCAARVRRLAMGLGPDAMAWVEESLDADAHAG